MPTSRNSTLHKYNPGRAGIRSSAKSAAPVVFLSPVENPLPGQNGRDASEMVDRECIVKKFTIDKTLQKVATVAGVHIINFINPCNGGY